MWTQDIDVDDGGVAAWFGRPFSVKSDLMLTDATASSALFPFPGTDDDNDDESDLVYFPGDSIAFPDDVPGNPFASKQQDTACDVTTKEKDPPRIKAVPPGAAVVPVPKRKNNILPTALNGKESNTASPVLDNVTGKILHSKVNDEPRHWSKPSLADFDGAASNGAAANAKNKKTPVPPHKLPVVDESKVNSTHEDDNYEVKQKQQNDNYVIDGNPVIIINNKTKAIGNGDDDVSATSSLSASNAGWYRHQSEVHEKNLRNSVPPKQSPVGVVFVQGSCSERINGIYSYTGMLDFVGVYTKVESYGDFKISFRIYRRLDESMSRKWFLSIGPGAGRSPTDHDIDLYSAPGQAQGPAASFVDELPPRNKWEAVAGTGLEGSRGPLCIWIPKEEESGHSDKEMPREVAPPVVAVLEPTLSIGGADETADKAMKNSIVKKSPPSQIIVQKKARKRSPPAVTSPIVIKKDTPSATTGTIFHPSETNKPCPIILPSKSTDTEATAATSTGTFEFNLERISSTSEGTPPTRQSICTSTNTSRSSSLSDLGKKRGQHDADLVEYNISELLDFPDMDEGFPTVMSISGEDVGNSEHEWSDLSDGEDDGVEAHGDTLVRQWTKRIADSEQKRHKIVKWSDDEEDGNPSVRCSENNLESEPDDEDFQFYARTKAGKQSIIVDNIGAALFRRFRHSPRSCRCAECKKEALEAYVENHKTPRGTLCEI